MWSGALYHALGEQIAAALGEIRLHRDNVSPQPPRATAEPVALTEVLDRLRDTDRDVVLLGQDILSEVEMKELLRRLCDPAKRVSTSVRDAVAYLHQHYRHRITRRQVANAVGMSEDYLSRMFHRELGLSPWTYLTRLRIQQAKIRLRESEDTIQAVARGVGIPDRAYFSRIFRKITGMPPRAYRESADRQNLPRKVRR